MYLQHLIFKKMHGKLHSLQNIIYDKNIIIYVRRRLVTGNEALSADSSHMVIYRSALYDKSFDKRPTYPLVRINLSSNYMYTSVHN